MFELWDDYVVNKLDGKELLREISKIYKPCTRIKTGTVYWYIFCCSCLSIVIGNTLYLIYLEINCTFQIKLRIIK